MGLRAPIIVCAVVCVVATAIPCQAQEGRAGLEEALPADIVEEFAGRPMPSLEMFRESGRLPAVQVPQNARRVATVGNGTVSSWLYHYAPLHGTLADDLVGEASLEPVCFGQPISDQEGAPSLWLYNSSGGRLWMYSSSVPTDQETCSKDYTNLLHYYETQVWSETAQSARMLVGADGGIRVWLNGAVVLDQAGPAEYEDDQYQADVSFHQGWNFIVVKHYVPDMTPTEGSSNPSRSWRLRLTRTDGTTPLVLSQATDGWCSMEEAPNSWVFANSAAHVAGVGSSWRSDLRLTNPYVYPLRVTLKYYPEGTVTAAGADHNAQAARRRARGAAATVTKIYTLQPYETRVFHDLLPSIGVSGDQKGALAIGGYYYYDAEHYDVVNLRTFNQSAHGTFGTTVPFYYQYEGATSWTQVLYGLRNGPDFRTNLACTPTSGMEETVEVTVKIWDPATGIVKEKQFEGTGYFQINDIFGKLGLSSLVTDSAVASVFITSSSQARRAFNATVNDNHTSDPVFVKNGYYIPLPTAP